jgi:hypothetical protein
MGNIVMTLREEWLTRAMARIIEDVFTPNELRMPPIIKVSVGLCGGKAFGLCSRPQFADDAAIHIFITPEYGSDNVMEILGTLVHELSHAHVFGEGYEDCKHGSPYSSIIRTIGLSGKPANATAEPGTELWSTLEGIAQELGEYPHKPLRKKEPKTRKSEVLTWKSSTDEEYTVKCKYSLSQEKGVPRDYNGEPMVPKDPDKFAELEDRTVEDIEEEEAAAQPE